MDNLTPEQRSVNMSRIRSRDTGPEMRVRQLLDKRRFRYETHDKSLPGCPDIIFPKRKLIIFIHGCFWHQHKNCKDCAMSKTNPEFWGPKLEGNAARDKRIQARLRRMGWRVSVVWECDSENELRLERRLNRILCPRTKAIEH